MHIIKWEFRRMINEKLFSKYGTAILNTKSCFLLFSTLLLACKTILIKF